MIKQIDNYKTTINMNQPAQPQQKITYRSNVQKNYQKSTSRQQLNNDIEQKMKSLHNPKDQSYFNRQDIVISESKYMISNQVSTSPKVSEKHLNLKGKTLNQLMNEKQQIIKSYNQNLIQFLQDKFQLPKGLVKNNKFSQQDLDNEKIRIEQQYSYHLNRIHQIHNKQKDHTQKLIKQKNHQYCDYINEPEVNFISKNDLELQQFHVFNLQRNKDKSRKSYNLNSEENNVENIKDSESVDMNQDQQIITLQKNQQDSQELQENLSQLRLIRQQEVFINQVKNNKLNDIQEQLQNSDKYKIESLVNYRDKYGKTPLHWSCQKNYIRITEILLNQGANPNFEDKNKKRPSQLAFDNNAFYLSELVEKYNNNKQSKFHEIYR